MSKYCGACNDNRLYLDAVPMCPGCGGALHRWGHATQERERVATETDVQVHILNRDPVKQPDSDLLPWLVGALMILVLAAVLVRA
jgi:hypothetical protein